MKKLMYLCAILMIYVIGNATSINVEKELLTYKNINGFEFKHKFCQKLEPMYSSDPETKDLSKVDHITLRLSCEKNQKRSVTFGPSDEKFKDHNEIISYFKKAYGNTKNIINRKKSSVFFQPEKNFLKANSLLYLNIDKISNDGEYRWSMYKKCENKVFNIEINIHIPINEAKVFESKIQNGEEILPPEEKKIIDSFKCINN